MIRTECDQAHVSFTTNVGIIYDRHLDARQQQALIRELESANTDLASRVLATKDAVSVKQRACDKASAAVRADAEAQAAASAAAKAVASVKAKAAAPTETDEGYRKDQAGATIARP